MIVCADRPGLAGVVSQAVPGDQSARRRGTCGRSEPHRTTRLTPITAVSEDSQGDYTILGWRVTNIVATTRGLNAMGVVFLRYDSMDQDDDSVWGHSSRRENGLVRQP